MEYTVLWKFVFGQRDYTYSFKIHIPYLCGVCLNYVLIYICAFSRAKFSVSLWSVIFLICKLCWRVLVGIGYPVFLRETKVLFYITRLLVGMSFHVLLWGTFSITKDRRGLCLMNLWIMITLCLEFDFWHGIVSWCPVSWSNV